eukprot:TRINITY_DN7320_c0_g1_i1.p1 TRINITY_DN7320_c0_g1~~TRINITY_DN7320_c0_g1_i1.p1  ORF type:complete len:948 (+),score=408.06 TRINITY_DN7320_c0_g1_i1:61-2844(+)
MASAQRPSSAHGARVECRPVWVEGTLSAEFEADTLPLLYADQSDYESYYTALQQKNPRRRRDLGAIKKLTGNARKMRDQGRLGECLALLEESLEARRLVFPANDYQLVSAQQHLCCTCIHFASHMLARGDSASALALFKQSKEMLRRQFPPAERPLFEVFLYNNWANYWYRRGRMSAAAQAAGIALARWSKVCTEGRHRHLAAFLGMRCGCALLQSAKPQEAEAVLAKALSELSAAEDDGGSVAEGDINVCAVPVRDEVPDDASDAAQTLAARPLRELVICLTSPYSNYNSCWPLSTTTRVGILCNLGQAKAALMEFKQGEELLRRAAVHFTQAAAGNEKSGNVWWFQQIQMSFTHCQQAIKEKRFAGPRVDHRNPAELGLQRLVLADTRRELKKKRERAALRKAQQDGDDDGDGDGEEEEGAAAEADAAEASPSPSPPPPDSDDSGDNTEPVWRTLVPALRMKASYRTARQQARQAEQAAAMLNPFKELEKRPGPLGAVAHRIVSKKERRKVKEQESSVQHDIQSLKQLEGEPAAEEDDEPRFYLYGAAEHMPQKVRQDLRDASAAPLAGQLTQPKRPAKKEQSRPRRAAAAAAASLAAAESPRQSPAGPRKKRSRTPADILSESIDQLDSAPPPVDAESVCKAAAERRISAAAARRLRLEEYVSALQQELETARAEAEALRQEEDDLTERLSAGAPPAPPQPPVSPDEPDGPRPQRAASVPPAPLAAPGGGGGGGYCDSGARHAPAAGVLASLGKSLRAGAPGLKTPPPKPKPVGTVPDEPVVGTSRMGALYSTRRGKGPPATGQSLAGDVRAAGQRQKRLRALLPHLDAHGATYRMVMKELAANQQVLTAQALSRRKKRMMEAAKTGRLALRAFSPPTSPTTSPLLNFKKPADEPPMAARWLAAAATWAIASTDIPSDADAKTE